MTRDVSSWAAPARIGRYIILERIGKGAMGVVYSARDEVMDRVVAVKVMMTDLEAEPDIRARFYREAQAAGRLLHPNIVTIFDAGEDEGRIYIVMELLKGVTLSEHLRQPGIAIEHKIGLMTQVCEGLASAHANGVVHRDIKPGNLFVLQDGTLKILDFGVARLANSTMTASGFIIGTPDYMSPEQARGKEIDARSDLFSAAGVFYYMLTGRKPFGAPDMPSVLRKVQSEMPRPVPETESPTALTRIVMRSLAKDPAERHQSAAELAADLGRFRRHFDSETRQHAMAVRASYEAVETLARERSETAARMGIDAFPAPAAATRLRNEHPAFVEPCADDLFLVPFTRAQVEDLRTALSAEQQWLAAQVGELRVAERALQRAREAMAERRFDAADQALNEARQANGPAQALDHVARLLVEARRTAAAEAALATKADEAISLARAEFHAGNRAASLDVLRECLASEPAAPGVNAEFVQLQSEVERLDEIERRLAADAWERQAREALSHEAPSRDPSAPDASAEALDRSPVIEVSRGAQPQQPSAGGDAEEDDDTIAIPSDIGEVEVPAPSAAGQPVDDDDTVSQALEMAPAGRSEEVAAPTIVAQPRKAPARMTGPIGDAGTSKTGVLRRLSERIARLFGRR